MYAENNPWSGMINAFQGGVNGLLGLADADRLERGNQAAKSAIESLVTPAGYDAAGIQAYNQRARSLGSLGDAATQRMVEGNINDLNQARRDYREDDRFNVTNQIAQSNRADDRTYQIGRDAVGDKRADIGIEQRQQELDHSYEIAKMNARTSAETQKASAWYQAESAKLNRDRFDYEKSNSPAEQLVTISIPSGQQDKDNKEIAPKRMMVPARQAQSIIQNDVNYGDGKISIVNGAASSLLDQGISKGMAEEYTSRAMKVIKDPQGYISPILQAAKAINPLSTFGWSDGLSADIKNTASLKINTLVAAASNENSPNRLTAIKELAMIDSLGSNKLKLDYILGTTMDDKGVQYDSKPVDRIGLGNFYKPNALYNRLFDDTDITVREPGKKDLPIKKKEYSKTGIPADNNRSR